LGLYYLETSALVKLYVREPGTERLLRLVSRSANHRLAVLALSQVELRSAIRRREREGDIDSLLASRLIERFDQHLEGRFLRQMVNDAVLDAALVLADRYPLRAYDAVQLAGCLALRVTSQRDDPVFVCADRQLLLAAESEGLASLDPAADQPT
jgi:hypothetical protein